MSKPILYIYRGLPGSGKSTDARSFVAENASNRESTRAIVIVERDILRRIEDPIAAEWYTQEFERAITKVQYEKIALNLRAGNNVISSDTNLPNQNVKQLMQIAVNNGADLNVIDFRDVTLAKCLENNENRYGTDKYVDPEFIKSAHERFIKGKSLDNPEIPHPAAPTDLLQAEPYKPSPMGVPYALVDLDGTLALHNGRNPYDTTKYHEDLVNGNVLDTIIGLKEVGYTIDVVTGRSAEHRQVCLDWLDKMSVPYNDLIMRPAGDTRRDDVVKLELFEQNYRNHEDKAVQLCIDDRDRVVSMYRNVLEIPVFQVNYGAF